MIEINRNPSTRELRAFGLIWLPAALVVLAIIAWRRLDVPVLSWILLLGAGAAVLVGWRVPQGLRRVYVAWMIAVYPIGWTISHLILALIFFGLVTPMGVVMRWFGYDPLRRRHDPESGSDWVARSGEPDASRYFRQF